MKTYVLTISEKFPSYHKRKGEPTNFIELIKKGIKLHTIRNNYELWEKRFKEIEDGKAQLSVRVWIGKPYREPQLEKFLFTKEDGIGIEKIDLFTQTTVELKTLATNDGLNYDDFSEWFKKADLSKPMTIIHFTPFRYSN